MPPRFTLATVLAVCALVSCTPPGDPSADALDPPPVGSGLNPALPSQAFPNAPSGGGLSRTASGKFHRRNRDAAPLKRAHTRASTLGQGVALLTPAAASV